MGGPEELIEALWKQVARKGVNHGGEYPQTLRNDCIQNFSLNFDPTVGTRLRSGGIWRARNDARTMTYKAFLDNEGQLPLDHPYKEDIMSCPLQLPSKRELLAFL